MLRRYTGNPVLSPSSERFWESDAVFNPCVVEHGKKIVMLYRACCKVQRFPGELISISSVGIAESKNGLIFGDRRFFFGPEYEYEAYGCEDPRVTKFKGKYYILYTAVSNHPPKPSDVKLALAVTEDFRDYEKFGRVCPFNSKAGFIFPRKIQDKMCMMFTLNPDTPPSNIAVVFFDKIEDLLDMEFWNEWCKSLKENIVSIGKGPFVEVGSPPIETEEGWLMFIPDIIYDGKDFLEFRISAALLDLEDPRKVIAVSKEPLLKPEVKYECEGRSPPTTKIAMPSGALLKDGTVYVYYGASDRYICVAYADLDDILKSLLKGENEA